MFYTKLTGWSLFILYFTGVRIFYLSLFLLLPAVISAQISAPQAGAVRYTSYPSNPGKRDPVFVFCNGSGAVRGALTAVSPSGTGPFSFAWYRWNDASRSFSIPVRTDPGVMNSSLTGLDEGGYRVVISGSGFSGSFDAWVYLDSPSAQASLMNATCDYVALSGEVAADTYYYRDPSDGAAVELPNGVRFMWSSNPVSTIPYPDYDLTPQTFDPPLTDVTYMLTVTDSMGCSTVSSFFYESIHVKADFTVDPAAGEAPLEVYFTDKSVRASKYTWEFGNETTSLLADPGPQTYYYPGQYSVKLVVESDLHCIDSMRYNYIVVEDSRLAVPNVFTPDGDGFNDMFVVEKRSLKYISVKIYSRSGLKVYDFDGEGDLLKEWEGWDGYVNNSSAKASPGVYYYVIRAAGWDDVIYDNNEYRGFVYLYR